MGEFLLRIAAGFLYFIESITGMIHYRNPQGWDIDFCIPAKTVKFWETKIRQLLEESFHENLSNKVVTLHADCLDWLGKYAVDDKNNRDEDNPRVVDELKLLGFFDHDGEFISNEVRVITQDVIHRSHKGASFHFRLVKKPLFKTM